MVLWGTIFVVCINLLSSDLIEKHGKIEEPVIACILTQVLRGLNYLHSHRKRVHRDIKPANILLNSEGVVKLSDFGLVGKKETTIKDIKANKDQQQFSFRTCAGN